MTWQLALLALSVLGILCLVLALWQAIMESSATVRREEERRRRVKRLSPMQYEWERNCTLPIDEQALKSAYSRLSRDSWGRFHKEGETRSDR